MTIGVSRRIFARMTLATLPSRAVLHARRDRDTREAALAELGRRVALHGPSSTRPAALAAAIGLSERATRDLLRALDAAGIPVTVGWVRTQGGGVPGKKRASRRKV